MPVTKLKLAPGVDLQSSPTLNQTKFSQSNLIRFYNGLVQKLGGWQVFSPINLIGTCRSIHGWADLTGNAYVAAGTEQRLQVLIGGAPTDITPLLTTTNPAVSFSTTAGSATVQIADSQAPNVGDWVNLITQVSVGGLILVGLYQVQSVGVGNYTITAASKATATVANGGGTPLFITVNGSNSVTVDLANHGQTASTSSFNVPLTVAAGGVSLLGGYIVATVINANSFTITAGAVATSTASVNLNGGNAQIQYLLPTGYATSFSLIGYGIGDYGSGDYGLAGSGAGIANMRVWSLDHWGQDLVACPNGGAIYYWQPGTSGPAVRVSNTSPLNSNWIFVASEVQILFALGAESGGTQYPLLVRWCDASDFTDWTPTAFNQAGSFQLNSGSMLITGIANGLSVYLWTDLGVWLASYQGLPYVWGFTEIARECGAISSRSVTSTPAGIVWLSKQGFFTLASGSVQPMECTVWDWYYTNVDMTQLQGVTAALNSEFHEVAWYFAMTAGGYGYVKWNWLEQVWDYGTLTRTAWMDLSPAGGPMGVDKYALIQQHEVGTDADGQPLDSIAQTGFFDVHDGEDYVFCDMVIPDFVASEGAKVNLTVLSQEYPGGPVKMDGPYPVEPNPAQSTQLPVNFITTQSRGRQIALLIQSTDLGSSWRLGALRYRWRPDGKL